MKDAVLFIVFFSIELKRNFRKVFSDFSVSNKYEIFSQNKKCSEKDLLKFKCVNILKHL